MISTLYPRPSVMQPREQLLALAGLVLAMVLLAVLVSVMNDNVAQAQSTRDMAELKMQERGRCNVLRNRPEREQCLLELRLSDEAQAQISKR